MIGQCLISASLVKKDNKNHGGKSKAKLKTDQLSGYMSGLIVTRKVSVERSAFSV